MTKKEPKLSVTIVTLFPAMFEGPLGRSIVGRARERGLVEIGFVDPRDFTGDQRRTVDDRPFGGGPGMVLMAQPLYDAIRKARRPGATVVYLSPRGKPFTQALAHDLARAKRLVLVCGRYEGVDERVLKYVDSEVSLGDFVLTGGEIPAMAVTDAVVRLVPGVLDPEAVRGESFSGEGALEHPHYTRPRLWRRMQVPEALVSGDHARVEEWRREAARKATARRRPDLCRAR